MLSCGQGPPVKAADSYIYFSPCFWFHQQLWRDMISMVCISQLFSMSLFFHFFGHRCRGSAIWVSLKHICYHAKRIMLMKICYHAKRIMLNICYHAKKIMLTKVTFAHILIYYSKGYDGVLLLFRNVLIFQGFQTTIRITQHQIWSTFLLLPKIILTEKKTESKRKIFFLLKILFAIRCIVETFFFRECFPGQISWFQSEGANMPEFPRDSNKIRSISFALEKLDPKLCKAVTKGSCFAIHPIANLKTTRYWSHILEKLISTSSRNPRNNIHSFIFEKSKITRYWSDILEKLISGFLGPKKCLWNSSPCPHLICLPTDGIT